MPTIETNVRTVLIVLPKMRWNVTTKPVLITETAVGQDAGRSARIPGLFDGMQRFGVRGIVWFDINQTGSVHHQRWALEGHPGEIAAFRKGLAAWQRTVG